MSRVRQWLLLALAVVVPLGFATKLYRGPAEAWVRGSAGGVLYVLFWCLLVVLLWPRLGAWRVAAGVLAVTSALEFLQLWHPPFLQGFRSTFLGHALIGSSFSWLDFPHYAAGALLSVLVIGRCLAGTDPGRGAGPS
jgi:hypothetical protein